MRDLWPLALRSGSLAALYAVAAAAGFTASLLHVPLPWVVGPFLITAIVAVITDMSAPPLIGRMTGQVILGSAVGLYVTPDALDRIISSTVPIVLVAVFTILAGCVVALVVARFGKLDTATAMFSSIPGGPVEMAILAERYGGVPGRVAFTQSFRIAAIVLVLPPLFLVAGWTFIDVMHTSVNYSIGGLAALLAIATATAVAFSAVRLTNPYFLGPMVGVGALTATGLHLSGIPGLVTAFGQLLLGVSLGAMFRRDLFRSGAHLLAIGIGGTLLLLLLCGLVAAMIAVSYGLSLEGMILAAAPGGVTEMAITAKAMSLDVSLIAAFHVVRIFVVVSTVPLVYWATTSLVQWASAPATCTAQDAKSTQE